MLIKGNQTGDIFGHSCYIQDPEEKIYYHYYDGIKVFGAPCGTTYCNMCDDECMVKYWGETYLKRINKEFKDG